MPRLPIASLVLALLLLLPPAAHALTVDFSGTVTVDAWDTATDGPGLDIDISDVVSPISFQVDEGGSTTVYPFALRTPEFGTPQAGDFDSRPLTLTFDFTLPVPFTVTLDGITQVDGAGTGNFAGFLRWGGLQESVIFGPLGDGMMEVTPSDRLFNEGFTGLNSAAPAVPVPVRFALGAAATVPEPAGLPVVVVAVAAAVGLGTARRRGTADADGA